MVVWLLDKILGWFGYEAVPKDAIPSSPFFEFAQEVEFQATHSAWYSVDMHNPALRVSRIRGLANMLAGYAHDIDKGESIDTDHVRWVCAGITHEAMGFAIRHGELLSSAQ
jgi:hypothetical protein